MKEESLILARNALGLIDLSQVEDEDKMSPEEHRAYCAAIHAVFPRLEKDLKRFMYNQLLFNAKECADWEQNLFGRGALDALAQVHKFWENASNEHESNSTGDGFNIHSPFNEI